MKQLTFLNTLIFFGVVKNEVDVVISAAVTYNKRKAGV